MSNLVCLLGSSCLSELGGRWTNTNLTEIQYMHQVVFHLSRTYSPYAGNGWGCSLRPRKYEISHFQNTNSEYYVRTVATWNGMFKFIIFFRWTWVRVWRDAVANQPPASHQYDHEGEIRKRQRRPVFLFTRTYTVYVSAHPLQFDSTVLLELLTLEQRARATYLRRFPCLYAKNNARTLTV